MDSPSPDYMRNLDNISHADALHSTSATQLEVQHPLQQEFVLGTYLSLIYCINTH